VFEYAHRAGGEDVGNLNDTQIRIASVTKVFTVLAVLLSRPSIGWEDSIVKFVPELDEEVYAEVTIKSLAEQTSGLGRFVRLSQYCWT
jgi:CubicO group peptidase (beta-lactamase class C family)